MKKPLYQKVIGGLRNKSPIGLRQKIGPLLAYMYYFDRLYVRPAKRPHVLSIEETVDIILEKKLSVIRFGDGEISLIDGMDIPFQKRTDELSEKLEYIFTVKDSRLLICIPGMWGSLSVFADYAYRFIMHHMYRYNHIWTSLLSYDRIYGDTNVTRHYLAYKDKTRATTLFKKIKAIWNNEDILLIEGAKSRLGVGNDLFANAKSIQRILCPPENAYAKYKEIEIEASKQDKKKLVLISLGPAAKVVAYDLFLLGYRVVDIGHIDMEYEMFLRKETRQVKVPHKYFNEINERNPIDCNDKEYLEQIIATIV